MFSALVPGVVAGALHVLSGPDHLAATAPLAAERPDEGLSLGLRWGVGHSLGIVLVGLAALLLRSSLPLDAISHWGERLVGVVLIALGIATLRRVGWLRFGPNPHSHDGETHSHPYLHSLSTHGHAALGIGILHGLAGSAHLLGVLPALAFPSLAEGAVYLSGFALGTVGAMGIFARGVAFGAKRFGAVGIGRFQGSLGLVALGVGAGWLILSI